MLASLRMRRLGRQWARLNLGVDGKRAMARYQLAATELAMACNRNSFGRTTEAYIKHRDDSLDLMRASARSGLAVRRQPLGGRQHARAARLHPLELEPSARVQGRSRVACT